MSKVIQVILIEDNPDYSDVVRLALKTETDICLADRFGSAEIAIQKMQSSSTCTSPDVILLDLRLPGMDGLESLPHILKAAPSARAIVLTQSSQEQDVLQAISQGAAGYLLKSANVNQLIESIRMVVDGGAPLDASVARFIIQTLQDKLPKDGIKRLLSERELQVLTLLAEGLVKKEIAASLNIGYSTVDTHVGRIYAKLKVNNAPAAVNEAHRQQLFRNDASDPQ